MVTGHGIAWGLVFLPLVGPVLVAAPEGESSCIACHFQLPDELGAPVASWESDVHAKVGLGCESCHGGDPAPELAEDPEAAKSSAAGFRGVPDRLQVADFCARCHSDAAVMKKFNPKVRVDQLAEYRTSVHGKLNAAGDPRPATCIDCHGVHGMLPVSSPNSPVYAVNVPETCARCHADQERMAPYGIPTNQYESYRGSMHAAALLQRGDTAAPACNDCHGNHGAAPPGVQSVAYVCGQCHGREASLFGASFKKDLFDAMEVGECTVCHDAHRVPHPSPELFRPDSAPRISQGEVTASEPFTANLGEIAAGGQATAVWQDVLRPYLEPGDPRLVHNVKILAAGREPLLLDATVQPGEDPAAAPPRRASSGALEAVLTIVSPSGPPVESGDALSFHLELHARPRKPVRNVRVEDEPGQGIDSLRGSTCRNCHSPGDDCDVATERMYGALITLDRDLRQASKLLHRAEIVGMEVSGPIFDLKSKGTTAAVEARSLIHSFDPDRLVARVEEGNAVAAAAKVQGLAALAENEYRRKGLAVSLVLVVLVLVALYAKIRQVARMRDGTAGGSNLDRSA